MARILVIDDDRSLLRMMKHCVNHQRRAKNAKYRHPNNKRCLHFHSTMPLKNETADYADFTD